MSKVETLRCEICGKTYLSDEIKDDICLMTTGENGKAYSDVCPECEDTLHGIIKDPGVLKTLTMDKCKAENHAVRLELLIKNLKDEICGWSFFTLSSEWMGGFEQYKDMASDILIKYEKIMKSRDNWRCAFIICLGFAIAFYILLVVS